MKTDQERQNAETSATKQTSSLPRSAHQRLVQSSFADSLKLHAAISARMALHERRSEEAEHLGLNCVGPHYQDLQGP